MAIFIKRSLYCGCSYYFRINRYYYGRSRQVSIADLFNYFSYVSGLFLSLTIIVLLLVWLERKVLARIQMRMGPMRVGFHGALQPIADAIKLISKEDILPAWADKLVYWFAPIVVFVPAFLLWVTIPFGKNMVIRSLDLGLFFIVAISVLSVLGLIMAGWGSANKYAVLGGLRAAGQLMSYEIPLIMAILTIAILSQSLNLVEIVDKQSQIPNIFIQPLGLVLFFIAGLAELGRTPFDIHHAESEVVGGPFVEYSGAHWSVFFLAEYINTFTISILTVLLFLGGWHWPNIPFSGNLQTILSVFVVLIKTILVVSVIFWIRATYPRLRIDQLMSFGWKMLIPMAFINVTITACIIYYDELPLWILPILSVILLILSAVIIQRKFSKNIINTVQVISAKSLLKEKSEVDIN
ncbi:MAG: NADH-quinone oxidoreductase subunit NuoH [Chloroflexi bacterium]|nr:NADH-quinone oxidoreductase subunit NuoH [Chloroflexota bacterium]